MTIRVLLVDDVAEWRRLVRTALRFRGDFEVVGEAADGAAAVTVATETRPDVVVLDLGLPDIAGKDLLPRLHECSPTSKVVVLSGTEMPGRSWLTDRVDGYVVKDADLDYLVDLLAAVGKREADDATLALPYDVSAVGRARRFVRDTLERWHVDADVDDALLVVSELVTNAITHGDSTCQLRLRTTAATLRVEVLDSGAGTPDPRAPSATREHGRGLHLVSALTTAWGIDQVPGRGKLVWAELPRTG